MRARHLERAAEEAKRTAKQDRCGKIGAWNDGERDADRTHAHLGECRSVCSARSGRATSAATPRMNMPRKIVQPQKTMTFATSAMPSPGFGVKAVADRAAAQCREADIVPEGKRDEGRESRLPIGKRPAGKANSEPIVCREAGIARGGPTDGRKQAGSGNGTNGLNEFGEVVLSERPVKKKARNRQCEDNDEPRPPDSRFGPVTLNVGDIRRTKRDGSCAAHRFHA